MRYGWGAQRLGFSYMEESDRRVVDCGTVHSVRALVDSGRSFFIESSLARRYAVPEDLFEPDWGIPHALVGAVFSRSPLVDLICDNILFAAGRQGFVRTNGNV